MALTFTHYVVSKYIKTDYENKHKTLVPQEVKAIVIKYSSTVINCDILSPKEDLDFVDALKALFTNMYQYNFELLFKASQHNFSANAFHKFCDNQWSTITIISSNHGNIFGGFTQKSFKYDRSQGGIMCHNGNSWSHDLNAFLFLIRSNKGKIKDYPIFYYPKDMNHIGYSIYYDKDNGPGFGQDDIRIKDKCDKVPSIFITPSSYFVGDDNLCGNDECLLKSPKCTMREFLVKDYYVFKVK